MNYSKYNIINDEILSELFKEADFVKPKQPGVYMVTSVEVVNNIRREIVLYIGSAKNIEKRIVKGEHPYLLLYKNQPDMSIITRSILTDDYIELEKEMIKFFKPYFNTAHNERPSGIILY